MIGRVIIVVSITFSISACARPPKPSRSGEERPIVALLLVLDKSGSMAGRPIQALKESCIGAANALGESDYVGVLAFDLMPEWVIPWGKADRASLIQASLGELRAGGGSDLSLAMAEAQKGFQTNAAARSAGVRHVILISDGDSRSGDWETHVKNMTNEGITVSTICITGEVFNARLMDQIARLGNGRVLFAGDFAEFPELVTLEMREALR